MFQQSFNEYVRFCIQRWPHYGIKHHGGQWRTKHRALADPAIKAHLAGKYSVAVIGQWYPKFINFDIDDKPIEYVQEIRHDLGLTVSNSALYSSVSPNSYHLLVIPQYNGEPPTLRLLQEVCKRYAGYKGIEIYPQQHRLMRLPFGPRQHCLDEGREHLDEWEAKLYWTLKLDEFDLSTMPQHQMILPLEQPLITSGRRVASYREGQEYFEYGLQSPSTRYHAQFCITLLLWRQNIPKDVAIQTIWQWLRTKHNGFSKDILQRPNMCREEIRRQVERVYAEYDSKWHLPDSTHNSHIGYITKPDIEQIMQVSRGNLPRMKFTYEFIKYSYPRRHRDTINIHSSKLRQWASSHSVDKYLEELREQGFVNRGCSYLAGVRSKPMSVNWPFRNSDEAIMYEGRSIDTFKDAVQSVFKPEEFQERVKAAGVSANTARKMMTSIFTEDKCSTNILSAPST